jgi:hypothetical protein
MNTEEKKAHFAQLRESQVILAKVNRELAATRETAERIKEKHGRDSERLLIDLETIEHYLVKLRAQLEDLSSICCEWERIEPKTYFILLDNENGDRFYYQGGSQWSEDKREAFVFGSLVEARGIIKQWSLVDFPWECEIHVVEAESGTSCFSLKAEKSDDL